MKKPINLAATEKLDRPDLNASFSHILHPTASVFQGSNNFLMRIGSGNNGC
jgi:hypothetical protein